MGRHDSGLNESRQKRGILQWNGATVPGKIPRALRVAANRSSQMRYELSCPSILPSYSTIRLTPTHRFHHQRPYGSSTLSTLTCTPRVALWMNRPLPM